jgi:hypothetical protein
MARSIAVAALMALLASGAAVHASAREKVLFSSGNLRQTYKHAYRPTYVLFGQRSTISGLRWRDWNSARARAAGTLEFNDCMPDCASGSLTYYRVAVTLSRIRTCNEKPHYLTMLFRYTGARPPGKPVSYHEGYGRLC